MQIISRYLINEIGEIFLFEIIINTIQFSIIIIPYEETNKLSYMSMIKAVYQTQRRITIARSMAHFIGL